MYAKKSPVNCLEVPRGRQKRPTDVGVRQGLKRELKDAQVENTRLVRQVKELEELQKAASMQLVEVTSRLRVRACVRACMQVCRCVILCLCVAICVWRAGGTLARMCFLPPPPPSPPPFPPLHPRYQTRRKRSHRFAPNLPPKKQKNQTKQTREGSVLLMDSVKESRREQARMVEKLQV